MLGMPSIPPAVPRVELPPDLSAPKPTAPKRKPNAPQKGMFSRAKIAAKQRLQLSRELDSSVSDFRITAIAIGAWKWDLSAGDPTRIIPQSPHPMNSPLLLRSLALLLPLQLHAEPLAPQPVWSGTPPAETLEPKPGQDLRGTVKNGSRTDVFTPEFVAWPATKPGAPVVIVCPGGGYGGLAEEHEGVEVAKRLNALGSAAVVLKYRVPRRSQDTPWVVPVLDAREMLRIVRKRAAEWNADPAKVGILGFSAGGNLAARVAYSPGEPDAPRPDFAVLVYPAY